ncbi:MAG: phosphatidylglycerol--prolipoprotein diacylglyceryl transferase [Candidatus Westeberhardia cardiocondylae]|nr:phosphatidylglycerol--prolipoprotein diacylglyceryl transferase [Candidatus Westeberhardia cardiocondylae]
MMYYVLFPQYDPVCFSLGSLSVYWYGIVYLLSFFITKWLVVQRSKCFVYIGISKEKILDLLYCCFIGMIIGGRVGYVIFYQFGFFYLHPLEVLKIWHGGMSFHGGLLGIVFVVLFYLRSMYCFFCFTDLLSPIIPLSLGMGRFANFINGELWGKVSVLCPFAMFFPNSYLRDIEFLCYAPSNYQRLFDQYGVLPRHPVQLYEMFLEGLCLFVLLNLFIKKARPVGSVSGVFLIVYGIFRIFSEFFRDADVFLCFLQKFYISMGQFLSFFMVLFGLVIILCSYSFCRC